MEIGEMVGWEVNIVYGKSKGKGKVHPRTGHEGPQWEV
jgi:hypothetical protein